MTLEERILKIINKIEYSDDGNGRIDTWGHTRVVEELLELVRIEVSNAFHAGDMYGYYIAGADAKPQPNKEQYLNQLK